MPGLLFHGSEAKIDLQSVELETTLFVTMFSQETISFYNFANKNLKIRIIDFISS